jgi:gamma-glutamyl-gamma-aminobutyrate hydrolase PuuD
VVPAGHAADVLARLDGLVLSGGDDVDPAHYGEPRTGPPVGGEPDPARDAWELALARHAVASGLPTLAICRGLQIVNVALGGSLVQHLDDHPDTAPASDGAVIDRLSHPLQVDGSSRLARRHPGLHQANSFHHQAVATPGRGVRVVATADDGVAEAIEVDGAERLVAVQWHPELLIGHAEHRALFEALIADARRD